MNAFEFNNATLKNLKDYGNIIKGIVQSRQATINPDGTVREKFVASRQVTFQDPKLIEQLREWISHSWDINTVEYKVTLRGYMTTTVRETDGKPKWYDNQIVTELELVK